MTTLKRTALIELKDSLQKALKEVEVKFCKNENRHNSLLISTAIYGANDADDRKIKEIEEEQAELKIIVEKLKKQINSIENGGTEEMKPTPKPLTNSELTKDIFRAINDDKQLLTDYSDVKEALIDIDNEIDSGFSAPEVLNICISGQDFEVHFNHDTAIEAIIDSYTSDLYVLGSFNASFIADNTNLNYELVKACQESEAYEAVGNAIIDTCEHEELVSFFESAVSADGYGHYLGSYDGDYIEVNDMIIISKDC